MQLATFFALAFFVPLTFAGDHGLPAKCLKEYSSIVSHYGNRKGHCARLQMILNCFKPTEKTAGASGKTLDAMRYLFYQEGVFVSKLGECKGMETESLKEVVKKSDLAKRLKANGFVGLDSVETSEDDRCALDVHRACIDKYLRRVMSNHDVCMDADDWAKCYHDEKARENCNAKILEDFTAMLDGEVGQTVINGVMEIMGRSCVSE
ncbi:uncharacterized protein LOC116619978 [Nematostella vectensis]|uniref:uncharacterized protein LOC116619978 n=1 Tax=Nematostella vectensis TaxID=45351 RepID=UPI0020775DF3|nr:uncharacterized protein LOC116619978 [Nematostella vectensis]